VIFLAKTKGEIEVISNTLIKDKMDFLVNVFTVPGCDIGSCFIKFMLQ